MESMEDAVAKTQKIRAVAPVTADSPPAPSVPADLPFPLEDVDTPPTPKLLPLGVHFGLPFESYLRDPGLGSGDLKLLAYNPCNYWYGSHMNPLRPPDKDTEARLRGRALHKIVLEGKQEFDRVFVCGPNQEGMTTAEKTASTKQSNKDAAEQGKLALKYDDYCRIRMAHQMVAKNPSLERVFCEGQSEVSLFWERDGVRCKGRFDYLKCSVRRDFMVAANGDLKSVGNPFQNNFEQECYDAIACYRYDAQAAHYLDGLMRLPSMIRGDAVHGDLDGWVVKSDWLARFLAPNIRFGWQWIFFQMTGAPITHSMTLSPRNPIIEAGGHVVDRGLTNYRTFMERFGTDTMWLLVEDPREAMIESMPGYYGR